MSRRQRKVKCRRQNQAEPDRKRHAFRNRRTNGGSVADQSKQIIRAGAVKIPKQANGRDRENRKEGEKDEKTRPRDCGNARPTSNRQQREFANAAADERKKSVAPG